VKSYTQLDLDILLQAWLDARHERDEAAGTSREPEKFRAERKAWQAYWVALIDSRPRFK
jgi:hypothetical protein